MLRTGCHLDRRSLHLVFFGSVLGLLGVPALLMAGAKTGDAAEPQATAADPVAPVAMPQPVPAREGIAALGDTYLWYWDTGGDGEPIVLLHPASGSALIWGYQQPVFAKAGYRVIAYSRRGYYNSQAIDRANPGTGAGDLQRLADQLGLAKFHLVASAAGGSIASDYALSHPDRLLSLTVSSNQFGVADGEISAAAQRIRPRFWDDLPVEYRELGPSYRAVNPDGFVLWTQLERKSGADNNARQPLGHRITEAMLASLKVPTLVIAGAADLATPPSIARMLAERIPGSGLVIAPESGHSVYWEEPNLFNQAVLKFIAKHKG
jgi:pimeloyl-ACP methyl ester carboxylesterase